MNVKNVEISDKLGPNLSGWLIYLYIKSPGESSRGINAKVDFNVLRDPNIPLGPINYGENVCFIQVKSYRSCIIYHYLEITQVKCGHLSKE